MATIMKWLLSHLFLQIERSHSDRYERWLPWNDLIDNRWNRAKRLGCGNGSSIYNSTIVVGRVTIGANTWVGPYCLLDGKGVLSIGNNVQISAGVQIYTHDSVNSVPKADGSRDIVCSCTNIGDNVYIGPNCIISRGVQISRGCIIGANSFLPKNIEVKPEGSTWYGSPARRMK